MIQLILESFSTIVNFVFVLAISILMFATAFTAHAKYLDSESRLLDQGDDYVNEGSMAVWLAGENEPYITSLL
jgi:hypothetical protein